MTIRFERVGELKQTYDQVYSATSPDLTAHSCVLIEQLDSTQTRFTTLEPGRAIFRRDYYHGADGGGEPGSTYLLEQTEFKDRLTRMKEAGAGSITLRQQRGVLSLIADYSMSPSLGSQERGRRTIRQYPGSQDDFAPLYTPTNKIAEVALGSFKSWVVLLSDFGQFLGEKKAETDLIKRTLLIELTEDKFCGMTNQKVAYMSYVHVSTNCECSNIEFTGKYAIEGRHLKRLINLSREEPISIYIDDFNGDTWISFEGDAGCMSFKAVEPEHKFLKDYQLFRPDPRINTESYRAVNLKELTSACSLQYPPDTALHQELVILQDPPNLEILQASNINGEERSYAAIDPTEVVGEWKAILINAQALKSSLKTLRLFIVGLSLQCNSIYLQQKSVSRKSGSKAWVLMMCPVVAHESVEINTFAMIKLAEESKDKLDSNE